MLPSLSALKTAPTAAWDDREELVVGGCKPGNTEGAACYDDWVANLITRVLENPRADSLILISVGRGVLELRALRTLVQLRSEDVWPIKNVILIDPYMVPETANEILFEYRQALPDLHITYYAGPRAYDDALKEMLTNEEMLVAAFGALNFGRRLSANQRDRNVLNTMIAIVEVAAKRLLKKTGGNLHVVQAYQDINGTYVQRDESAFAFSDWIGAELAYVTREHMQKLNL